MMNKKIIISIVPHLEGGGVERVVAMLSEGLVRQKNCECHIITIRPHHSLIPISDIVRVHNLDLTKRNLLNFRMSARVKSKIVDDYIIENISPTPHLILAHQETVSKSIKNSKFNNVIYHVVHSNLTNARLGQKKGLSRFFSKSAVHNLYRNKNCVAVSEGVKEDLTANFNLSSNRIKVITNAVDEEFLNNQSTITSIDRQEEYFLHVGNFSAAKRHDRLVESYLKSGVKTPLRLIGKESKLTEAVAQTIKKNCLEDHVIIQGYESNPYPWIRNAKGLILSSDYEGLVMVLLEAIALGTPIISTNCKSGPAEIVGDNTHCLTELSIDSLALKIKELDDGPEKFRIPLLDKFKIESMVNAYYQLIDKH
ncbi:TPA: glycosyltransferase [Vibrio vulnificus]|nr:glycosyltransferase [Vibrio vulnificus]